MRNCAAIPPGLLESELFGHERGAYTGAVARSIGRFERANRGTLFLDEIGDLPLELQPKILRVIEDRQFERLGSVATIRTDVRVICATHRNLPEMVTERELRADLFYRLSVFPIDLPPLRERPKISVCWFTILRCIILPACGSQSRPSQRNSWQRLRGIRGRATSGSCKTL